MKYGVRVRDIVSRRLIKIKPTATVVFAAKLMKKEEVGALIVCKQNKLVGIITDGDIIKRVVANGTNPVKKRVADVMTQNPITVSLDDDLYKVSKLMNERKIKRVIVMDKGNLIGYLSERDLLKVEPGILDVLIEKLNILQPSFKLRYERV